MRESAVLERRVDNTVVGNHDREEKPKMNQSKMLEEDIRELQDKVGVALDCYLKLLQRYGNQLPREVLEGKLDEATTNTFRRKLATWIAQVN